MPCLYAEWVMFVDGEYGGMYECGNCHQYSYSDEINMEPTLKVCPHCGAFMRGMGNGKTIRNEW